MGLRAGAVDVMGGRKSRQPKQSCGDQCARPCLSGVAGWVEPEAPLRRQTCAGLGVAWVGVKCGQCARDGRTWVAGLRCC